MKRFFYISYILCLIVIYILIQSLGDWLLSVAEELENYIDKLTEMK